MRTQYLLAIMALVTLSAPMAGAQGNEQCFIQSDLSFDGLGVGLDVGCSPRPDPDDSDCDENGEPKDPDDGGACSWEKFGKAMQEWWSNFRPRVPR